MREILSTTRRARLSARRRGLSLIELLLSLAISAMLLTATMVAIDASFQSYAVAAESASAQSASRMITHRLLHLIRTSTAHGPLLPRAAQTIDIGGGQSIEVAAATLNGNTITSPDVELVDARGNLVRIVHDAVRQQLWILTTPPAGAMNAQPLVGGVSAAQFVLVRRRNNDNLWVLDRGTIDYTIEPNIDQTLQLEGLSRAQAVRVIASTMPRRLEN